MRTEITYLCDKLKIMVWIISILLIVAFFAILSIAAERDQKNQVTQQEVKNNSYQLDFPNPEKASPKDVLEAIDKLDANEVFEVERFLTMRNINFQEYKGCFYEKQIGKFCLKGSLRLWQPIEITEKQTNTENRMIFDVTGCFETQRKNHLLNHCLVGDKIRLLPEPTNIYDEKAIKITCNGKCIGYISATDTKHVHKILTDPYHAYVSKIDYNGDYLTSEIAIEY